MSTLEVSQFGEKFQNQKLNSLQIQGYNMNELNKKFEEAKEDIDISQTLQVQSGQENDKRKYHKIASKIIIVVFFLFVAIFTIFSMRLDPIRLLFTNFANLLLLIVGLIQIISELYKSHSTAFVSLPHAQTLETNFGYPSFPFQFIVALMFHENRCNFLVHCLKIVDCWLWYFVLKLNFNSNIAVLLLYTSVIIQAYTQTKNALYLVTVMLYHGMAVLICIDISIFGFKQDVWNYQLSFNNIINNNNNNNDDDGGSTRYDLVFIFSS